MHLRSAVIGALQMLRMMMMMMTFTG